MDILCIVLLEMIIPDIPCAGSRSYEPILICEVGNSPPRQETLHIVYFMGKALDAINAVPRTDIFIIVHITKLLASKKMLV